MKKLSSLLILAVFTLLSCNAEELAKKDKDLKDKETQFAFLQKEYEHYVQLKEQELKFLKDYLEKNNRDIDALSQKVKKYENLEKDYASMVAVKKMEEQLYSEKVKTLNDENQRKEKVLQDKELSLKKIDEELKRIRDENTRLLIDMEKNKRQFNDMSDTYKTNFQNFQKENSKLKVMEDEVKKYKDEISGKNKQLSVLQEEVNELKKFQEMINKDADKIREALKNEIKNGSIIVDQTSKRIQVIMMEQVLFKKAEISLTGDGERILKKIAAVLKEVKDKEIFVIGHADSDPVVDPIIKKIFPTNWEFSVMRAVMVVRYLSEILEVNPSIFTAGGRSFYQPILSESSEKNKSVNRRTEVLIFPRLEKVKVLDEEKKNEKNI